MTVLRKKFGYWVISLAVRWYVFFWLLEAFVGRIWAGPVANKGLAWDPWSQNMLSHPAWWQQGANSKADPRSSQAVVAICLLGHWFPRHSQSWWPFLGAIHLEHATQSRWNEPCQQQGNSLAKELHSCYINQALAIQHSPVAHYWLPWSSKIFLAPLGRTSQGIILKCEDISKQKTIDRALW